MRFEMNLNLNLSKVTVTHISIRDLNVSRLEKPACFCICENIGTDQPRSTARLISAIVFPI